MADADAVVAVRARKAVAKRLMLWEECIVRISLADFLLVLGFERCVCYEMIESMRCCGR